MIMQREEVIDVSDIRGLCDGRIRFNTQFLGGAIGAKNEALPPVPATDDRVPHIPDFL
jgi:hypothetical protein